MAGTTDLSRDFSKRFGLTQADSRKALEFICDDIRDRLGKGETVNIRGFGVFKAKDMAERTIRNPQTQEPSTAPATVRVLFTAAKALKLNIKKDHGLTLTEEDKSYLAKCAAEGVPDEEPAEGGEE